jgi:guanylate kinase
MAKVFVITGPSGVGKGTLISKLLERVPDLELSVSATTREPREGEVDGRDYHFLSPDGFDRRIENEELLEFATYSGHRYGTLRAAMRESVQVFIAPPAPEVLRQRLESRGADSAAAIDARLEVAEQELAAQDEFAYRVVNDDLERAVGELEGIVRAELGLPLDSAAE